MIEGVIKFTPVHRQGPLAAEVVTQLGALAGWRSVLFRMGGLGIDPRRYGGAAYGNVSVRLAPYGMRAGARRFVVSGTQTGGRASFAATDVCVVEAYDFAANSVTSHGEVLPSSESLTHAALYDLDADLRVILHVHAPELWHAARRLDLPSTDPNVAYGTLEMAREVRRLYRDRRVGRHGVIVMGGHEDGVLSFGRDADQAGRALVTAWAHAVAG